MHDFYTDEDRSRGGIFSISREGDERFFPIMTLSIGVVTPNTSHFISHRDIAIMASQAKHNAKNILGNSLFIERRQSGHSMLKLIILRVDYCGEITRRKPMNGLRAPGSAAPRTADRALFSASLKAPPRITQRASSDKLWRSSVESNGNG